MTSSPVSISLVEHDHDRIVATVAGEMDHSTSAQFGAAAMELLTDDVSNVVLDMAEVAFCDSAGIGALVDILRRTRRRDGALVLAAATGNVTRALALAGLADLIPAYPTVADAVDAIAAPSDPT
jgi:anti-sigma B factor antagonist